MSAAPGIGQPSIGWLGTGRMGTAIVGRLLDAGRPVTVWNRTPTTAAGVQFLGAPGRGLEVPMPTASTVYQVIQSAIGNGLREEDFLSLHEHQAHSAGLAGKKASRDA